jgi:hypothetical protein
VEELEDRCVLSTTLYVQALYAELLNRAAQPAEVQTWVNLLNGGVSPQTVTLGFVNSPEFRTNLIQNDFQNILHRRGGATEVAFYLNALQGGLTDQQLESLFLASPEFFSRQGNSNFLWVTTVYQNVLGRTPDPVGLSNWLNILGSGVSRTTVALEIIQSPEAHARVVTSLYAQLLRRVPDPGGAQFWEGLLNAGQITPSQLAATLAASPEFIVLTSGGGLDFQGSTFVGSASGPIFTTNIGGNAFVVTPFGPLVAPGPSFGFSSIGSGFVV